MSGLGRDIGEGRDVEGGRDRGQGAWNKINFIKVSIH